LRWREERDGFQFGQVDVGVPRQCPAVAEEMGRSFRKIEIGLVATPRLTVGSRRETLSVFPQQGLHFRPQELQVLVLDATDALSPGEKVLDSVKALPTLQIRAESFVHPETGQDPLRFD
jgi:hypothetical protein